MYGTVGARGLGVAAQDMELVSRRGGGQRVGTTTAGARTARAAVGIVGAVLAVFVAALTVTADSTYTRMVTIWKILIIVTSPASSDT